MSDNKGKQFEERFKQDWIESMNSEGTIDTSLDRLYDTTNGYATISNISDFIGYKYPYIFYLECKSHKGNTWPWSCFSQYDKLLGKVGIHGVRAGVVLWMRDHDVVVYLPVSTVKKMKEDGHKSFNVKMLDDAEYNIVKIPSEKLRVFMKSDYSVMMNLKDGE